MYRKFLLVSIVMHMLPLHTQAAENFPGVSFTHNDWELACDNTGTCRAAGYQSDGDEHSISVLLTREAGPNQPVTGRLMIGEYGEEVLRDFPAIFTLSLTINGKKFGEVEVHKDTAQAELPANQLAALLAALRRTSTIEWRAGEYRWHLSDSGASAVLLKMDEYQGRLDTQGALIRKGARHEDAVLKARPAQVVIAAPLVKPLPSDKQLTTNKALREALLGTAVGEVCPSLPEAELLVTRLTENKLLVSALCWLAAYNAGSGYWVVNDTPPYQPVLVTTSGTDDSGGAIYANHKGRGLGDCWSTESWTWDGKEFVHTESSTSGMCKLLAPGGAWTMPTLVTEVRQAAK